MRNLKIPEYFCITEITSLNKMMKSRALTHIVFGILFMIHTFNASSQARQLNLPVKELSVLINHTMGLHFLTLRMNTGFKKHTGVTPTEYRKKHALSAS